jgi:16S rRNA (cytosine967-C5)-methyltransferase
MTIPRQPAPRKAAPKNRSADLSPARKAAFHILLAVERGQSHSDDLLRGKAVDALSSVDRNLATALVLGVLRWQIRIDHQLRTFLTHPNAKIDAEILIALRMGAFQILYFDRIPARAAIDESVELAKQAGHRFASGMVNAVLRKLAGAPRIDYSEENAAELALAEAHPAWMVERWADFYGFEAARAICRHGQIQPAITVRFANANAESELNQAGVLLERGQLLTGARTAVAGEIAATAAFLEGRVSIQDEGSQLVAELAAASLGQEVKSILDACAAPGGKTIILAERHPQARILACESSEARFEQLRNRFTGHARQIDCLHADASQLAEMAAFDLVLADVPCSGTGTLGRNPEIRHRLRPEDLMRQAERQRAILASALRAVRPGGSVIYSTCSLEPEENEQVVAAVLAETPTAHIVSLGASIASLRRGSVVTSDAAARLQGSLTPQGALHLRPGEFRTDGFFIALVERDK